MLVEVTHMHRVEPLRSHFSVHFINTPELIKHTLHDNILFYTFQNNVLLNEGVAERAKLGMLINCAQCLGEKKF